MNFPQQLGSLKKEIDRRVELFFAKLSIKDPLMQYTYKNIRDFVLAGGKRLRPAALIMAYNGLHGNGLHGNEDSIFDASLSVEFLHNSTLIHDDIMDEDKLRRNIPTSHERMKQLYLKNREEKGYDGILFNRASARFAASASICQGNLLLNLGGYVLTNAKFSPETIMKALKVHNHAVQTINHGQLEELFFSIGKSIKEKDYLRMAGQKTANLFAASVKIGGIFAEAKADQLEKIGQYAHALGIAFQLQDDIMELKRGDSFGADIKRGTPTLLTIRTLDKASKREKEFLEKAFGNHNLSDSDLQKVVDLIKATGALEYAQALARKKIKESKAFLKEAQLTQESFDFFNQFADFMAL